MARIRKKHDNESITERTERLLKEKICNKFSRSEKVSWNRKMDNMVKLLSELEPIEQEILDLIVQKKQPIMDKIAEIRAVMVNECVHPYEYLAVLSDNVVECKFCGKTMRVTINDDK